MKFVIAFALFVALACAAPQGDIQTVKFDQEVNPDGYSFGWETSDGTKHDEVGTLKDAPPTEDNPNNKAIDVVGSYEFTTPEGKTYRVEYTSGVNGYQPKVSIVN